MRLIRNCRFTFRVAMKRPSIVMLPPRTLPAKPNQLAGVSLSPPGNVTGTRTVIVVPSTSASPISQIGLKPGKLLSLIEHVFRFLGSCRDLTIGRSPLSPPITDIEHHRTSVRYVPNSEHHRLFDHLVSASE